MPSSALSETISWGVYLSAAVCLVAVLNPILEGMSSRSGATATSTSANSLAKLFDGLAPGESLSFTYHGIPGGQTRLGGHWVNVSTAAGEYSSQCSALLLPTRLESGAYRASLLGSAVVVLRIG